MRTLKVAVIGAGALGSALTAELVRRGASVALIDAAEAGSGTSSATFAWINGNDKAPEEYAYLNYLGLQAHERWAGRGARWFHQTGMMQVAQSADDALAYERAIENVPWDEYRARLLTQAEVLEKEPGLNSDLVLSGAFYPREGWLDVDTMCTSLVQWSVEHGATFHPFARATEIVGSTVKVVQPDGTPRAVEADVVVVAAGNGTAGILRSIDVDWPVLDPFAGAEERSAVGSSVGVISTTAPVRSGIRHFVRSKGIALRPARNGGITFSDHPTGGRWGQHDPRTWEVPGVLFERVKRLYPSLAETFVGDVRLGTRVLPTDGLTVADWVAPQSSVYAISTHSGVTLSAHLAEAVADQLLTGQRHDSLRNFGFDRFHGATMTA